ncbi:prolyl endopeptidase FAP-like isoform X2 [Dermatophagoides pteronyssinus]|uniref:prolyl endopeptidase FAP-like isoform X2 n=1 Tax=Dermatophagoides pteronyssinus TaxID=6956 RepID=UPI003F66CF90
MTEFDNDDNDTVIPDDFREMHELSTVDVKTSNWKGTLISILVIVLLSSAIILAIYLINPDIQNKFITETRERLKLEELLHGNYTIQPTFNGTWISDTEITFISSAGDFALYDVRNDKTDIIIYARIMKQHEVDRAILSPNRQYVLLISHIKNLFRHSTLAHYKAYNLSNDNIINIRPHEANSDASLQAAEWGPKNAQLVFVFKNNIYYMPDPNESQTYRISHDDDRYIYNGIPDWIYEEEILATSTAFWWSKDGKRLAYARFNDSKVEIQEYPWYGDQVDVESQYLGAIKIKYPKPGTTNPTITLHMVDLENSDFIPYEVLPPFEITKHSDYYLTSVAWADRDCLIAVWMTREQNYASYSWCSPSSSEIDRIWKCQESFHKELRNGWVEISAVHVDQNGQNFYTLHSDDSSEQFVQIIKVNIKTYEKSFITSGKRDVTKILKIIPFYDNDDGEYNKIYYLATRINKPGERHVYNVVDKSKWMITTNRNNNNNNDNNNNNTTKCITCDQIELNQCLYNRLTFSHNGTYYIRECLGPNIPYSTLHRLNDDDDHNYTRQWEMNEKLKLTLSKKLLPTIVTEIINRTDYVLIVQMFLPPSFKPDSIVKYPLLIQVYGGPGSQNVNENFKMNYGKFLAGSTEIIYAYVDGRGSGFQGEKMKHYLFHRLGTVEIDDQIIAARYLRDKYNFINRAAIGIWGWSYGGYATTKILLRDQNDPVFACGISVAPVTSWLLYDSAYTERYMSLPTNKTMENYQTSSVMYDVNHLQDINHMHSKKFLLIHGTADDNVHIQNSMVLIKELNKKNIIFNTQIYPDENHGLPSVSIHLYQTMTNFWNDCFKSDSFVEEIGLRRRRVSKNSNDE